MKIEYMNSNRFPFFVFYIILLYICHSQVFAQPSEIAKWQDSLLNSSSDTSRVFYTFKIGEQSWFNRNLPLAKEYLHKSIQLSEKHSFHKYEINATNLLAHVYRASDNFDSAFFQLGQAMEKIKRYGDDEFQPLVYDTYGVIYSALGDNEKASQYGILAVEGFQQSKNKEIHDQLAFGYISLGAVMQTQGQHEEALTYFEKGLEEGRKTLYPEALTYPMTKVADAHFALGHYQKAQHIYDTLLAVSRQMNAAELAIHAQRGLGNIALAQNKPEIAFKHYQQAIANSSTHHINLELTYLHILLGKTWRQLNQNEKAENMFELALSEANTRKELMNMIEANKELASLSKQKGEYELSLNYYETYNRLKDSVATVEKNKAINSLHILHQTQEKEKENKLLRIQQLEKDAALRKRSFWIVGLSVGLCMLVFLLQLLRRNSLLKDKLHAENLSFLAKQQQIESLQSMLNGEESERTRIAKDLHDGLGGTFSTIKMMLNTVQNENPHLQQNDVFQKSYEMVKDAVKELRRIAHNLMPEVLLRYGLIQAFTELCHNISTSKVIQVHFQHYGMESSLAPSTEIMLFRILQELLHNIIKHSGATEAIIQFNREGNELHIIVEDNGKGFNPDEITENGHAGLKSIKNRVEYLKGNIDIDSQQGMGTTVNMTFLLTHHGK